MLDPGFAVQLGREAAEAMMDDTLLVEYDTGAVTRDPVTLTEVPVYATRYAGKGRIQRSNGTATNEQVAGGTEFGVNSLLAQLPITATGIRKGDRLTVTGIGADTDPDLLGLVATVQANRTKTHPTKRTLVCEEVT